MSAPYINDVINQLIKSELDKRRRRGIQADMARAIGVERTTISNWVRGMTQPDPSRYTAIEEYFDLEPNTLKSMAGFAVESSLLDQVREMSKKIEALEADIIESRNENRKSLQAVVKLVKQLQKDQKNQNES